MFRSLFRREDMQNVLNRTTIFFQSTGAATVASALEVDDAAADDGLFFEARSTPLIRKQPALMRYQVRTLWISRHHHGVTADIY